MSTPADESNLCLRIHGEVAGDAVSSVSHLDRASRGRDAASFLPGRHDPLATSLSASATGASFAGLLLVPIAVVWLTTPRGYAPAKAAVMYNPRGEQDFSSHAFDLLRLPPEEIRRQPGHFAAHELPQARWKRFLFD